MIIINDTINLFSYAVSILVISNRNSFRVVFEKKYLLPSVLSEKYTYILALEMTSPGNQHCANFIRTLSFPAER